MDGGEWSREGLAFERPENRPENWLKGRLVSWVPHNNDPDLGGCWQANEVNMA